MILYKNQGLDSAVHHLAYLKNDLNATILLRGINQNPEENVIYKNGVPFPSKQFNWYDFLDRPRIADTKKIDAAIQELQQIYKTPNLSYDIRYCAGKILDISEEKLDKQSSLWLDKLKDEPQNQETENIIRNLMIFYGISQPSEILKKAAILIGLDKVKEYTNLESTIDEVERLIYDLDAEIVIQEEEGHYEDVECYPYGSRYGTYDCWETENRWFVDKERIVEGPDTKKRDAAQDKLTIFYNFSEYYSVRYNAGSSLKNYDVGKNELKIWLRKLNNELNKRNESDLERIARIEDDLKTLLISAGYFSGGLNKEFINNFRGLKKIMVGVD